MELRTRIRPHHREGPSSSDDEATKKALDLPEMWMLFCIGMLLVCWFIGSIR